MTTKFYATLEFLSGQSAAILTLTDQAGEWAGSSRVEGRDRSDIYERAYTHASLSAQWKGGHLERFSVVTPEPPKPPRRAPLPDAWLQRREKCRTAVTPAFLHRRANALNVEPMQPMTRCLDKKPEHWPEGSSALRWIASGGEAYVFGLCSRNCPRESS